MRHPVPITFRVTLGYGGPAFGPDGATMGLSLELPHPGAGAVSGFEISDGHLVLDYGARRVATTGGTLLQFLSDELTYSASIAFPNADKARLCAWR